MERRIRDSCSQWCTGVAVWLVADRWCGCEVCARSGPLDRAMDGSD